MVSYRFLWFPWLSIVNMDLTHLIIPLLDNEDHPWDQSHFPQKGKPQQRHRNTQPGLPWLPRSSPRPLLSSAAVNLRCTRCASSSYRRWKISSESSRAGLEQRCDGSLQLMVNHDSNSAYVRMVHGGLRGVHNGYCSNG